MTIQRMLDTEETDPLKCLAHPARVKIAELLIEHRDMLAKDIVDRVREAYPAAGSQAAAAFHIKEMLNSGLLRRAKNRAFTHYSLSDKYFRTENGVNFFDFGWCQLVLSQQG